MNLDLILIFIHFLLISTFSEVWDRSKAQTENNMKNNLTLNILIILQPTCRGKLLLKFYVTRDSSILSRIKLTFYQLIRVT